jgi:xanthine phosphoribosyltransferase
MYHYQYDEFLSDLNRFVTEMGSYKPDIILAIARGGVTFGHFLSEKLNIRELYTLNSIYYDDTIKRNDIKIYNIPNLPPKSEVLVVDDIADSGETLHEVMRRLQEKYPSVLFKTGVLFYKEKAIYQPDFKVKRADDWIQFFWNINE